jgi:hypothetical protein
MGVGETPPFALYLGFRTHRGNRRRVCFYCRAHIVGLTDAPLEVVLRCTKGDSWTELGNVTAGRSALLSRVTRSAFIYATARHVSAEQAQHSTSARRI